MPTIHDLKTNDPDLRRMVDAIIADPGQHPSTYDERADPENNRRDLMSLFWSELRDPGYVTLHPVTGRVCIPPAGDPFEAELAAWEAEQEPPAVETPVAAPEPPAEPTGPSMPSRVKRYPTTNQNQHLWAIMNSDLRKNDRFVALEMHVRLAQKTLGKGKNGFGSEPVEMAPAYIAACTGLSERRVGDAMATLERSGYITRVNPVERTFAKKGQKRPNANQTAKYVPSIPV